MYVQLIDQIRLRVAAGDWPAGYELPSIRELAADSLVSVITVKRAYLELERQGVIVTRQGRGSFVADDVSIGEQVRLQEFAEHLERLSRLAILLGLSEEEVERRLRKKRSEIMRERKS